MSDVKTFALTGAAGYIAPRHMKAIKDTGNELTAALDVYDAVGIIDSYFPQAEFFTEFELFDNYLERLKREDKKIDYLSIATPNYLHLPHIGWALRNGYDAICEKPLVLNPSDIDELKEIEQKSGKRVYNILQLRLHESIKALKEKVEKELQENPNKVYDIDLTYLTSRGKWYFVSWKGNEKKSGGLATNIGVHFYDMLSWIFGGVKQNIVHIKTKDAAAGYLELEHARVRWFLSVNYDYIPQEIKATGQRTYRSITIDSQEIEFSGGFTELHTRSYEEILKGNGFGLDEARKSIEIVSTIRNLEPVGLKGEWHPFCKKVEG